MTRYFKGIFAVIVSTLLAYNKVIKFTVTFIILDVVSGIISSLRNNVPYSKEKARRGFWNKTAQILCMGVGFVLDSYIGYVSSFFNMQVEYTSLYIGTLIGAYISINEILSILKNLTESGVNIPETVRILIEKIYNFLGGNKNDN